MLFDANEIEAQKKVIAGLQSAIGSEVAAVQATLRTVEAAKAKIGNMQIELVVEERILERMTSSSGSVQDEHKD